MQAKWFVPAIILLLATGAIASAQSLQGAASSPPPVRFHPNSEQAPSSFYTFDGSIYRLGTSGDGYMPLVVSIERSITPDATLSREILRYAERTNTGRRLFWLGAATAFGGAGLMYYATFAGGSATEVYSGVAIGALGAFIAIVGQHWAGNPSTIVGYYNSHYAAQQAR